MMKLLHLFAIFLITSNIFAKDVAEQSTPAETQAESLRLNGLQLQLIKNSIKQKSPVEVKESGTDPTTFASGPVADL